MPDHMLGCLRDQNGRNAPTRIGYRWPLVDIIVGALAALTMGWLMMFWTGLAFGYLGLVLVGYLVFAAVVLWAWESPPSFHLFHWELFGKVQVHMGWANRVTLSRALLVLLVAAIIPFHQYAQQTAWTLALIGFLALCLDGVDGRVARRTGTETAWGARFDMEVDAAFIMVLSLLLVVLDRAGLWVLTLGLMRYAFVAASQIWRWIKRPLPPSFRRQAVCVWQVASLLICIPPLLPQDLMTGTLVTALALLVYSFAVDLWWLFRCREQPITDQPQANSRGVDNVR